MLWIKIRPPFHTNYRSQLDLSIERTTSSLASQKFKKRPQKWGRRDAIPPPVNQEEQKILMSFSFAFSFALSFAGVVVIAIEVDLI
jgi:hypothetical protein